MLQNTIVLLAAISRVATGHASGRCPMLAIMDRLKNVIRVNMIHNNMIQCLMDDIIEAEAYR